MAEKPDLSTSQRAARYALALVIGLGLLLFINRGCGTDGRVEVFGRVVLDGDDLATGQIFFTPAPGTDGPAAGGRITDGAYRISFDAASVSGEYQIRITTGEPGPSGGGGGRLGSKEPREPSVSYYFTRTLTASTREQNYTLSPEAKQKPAPR